MDVIDKNDNDPQFVGEPFVFSIRENPDVGSIVGTVSATDADSGSNARLVFSSGISSHFNVTSSGVIVVNNPAELDREMQMNFFLEVTVRDSGEPVNMQSTTVTVTLRDAKDTPPEFTMDTYAGSIAEGSGQENLVATVSASDKDEDDPITYQIESGERRNTCVLTTVYMLFIFRMVKLSLISAMFTFLYLRTAMFCNCTRRAQFKFLRV